MTTHRCLIVALFCVGLSFAQSSQAPMGNLGQISGPALTVNGIQVNPVNPSLAIGAILNLSATPVISNGSPNIDVTAQCAWTSSNTAVAAFLGGPGNILQGIAAGTTAASCTLKDSAGNITQTGSTIVTVGSIVITNPACATPPCVLPQGTNGAAYPAFIFAAAGGVAPYAWSVTVGAFQTGLSLSSAGVLSGTPSVTNTQAVTVQVSDANALTATVQVSLTTTGAAGCFNPPFTYCSDRTINVYPGPNTPPAGLIGLNGAGNMVNETGIGTQTERILRVTDYSTAVTGSHTGVRTASSGVQRSWNCGPSCGGTGYYFIGLPAGGTFTVFFQDPTAWATAVPPSCPTCDVLVAGLTTASGGWVLNPDSTDWSLALPNVFYGVSVVPSSSAYTPAKFVGFTASLTDRPWTSGSVVPTPLLDQTTCTGLTTQTSEFNQYNWGGGADVSASAGDAGGIGQNLMSNTVRYQQDESALLTVFDGSQPVGAQQCSWFNFRTAKASIHGAAAVAMTGFGTIPAPAAPVVTATNGTGNLTCGGVVRTQLTYTNNAGESSGSPITSTTLPGTGSTCSIQIAPPTATVSAPGLSGYHPNGYNTYACNGPSCTPTLQSNGLNISLNLGLARPLISSVVCATAGSTSYKYWVAAKNSSGASAWSLPVTVNNCAAKITATNKITVTLSGAVSNATAYEYSKDFQNVGISSTNTSFVDVGNSPTIYQNQIAGISTPTTLYGPFYVGNDVVPTVSSAGIKLHNSRLNPAGTWLYASATNSTAANVQFAVDVSNGTVLTFDNGSGQGASVSPLGSHIALDGTHILGNIAGSTTPFGIGSYTLSDNPVNVQASQASLNTNPAAAGNSGNDFHYNYPFSGNGNVIFDGTYIQAGSYALPAVPWDGEILAFSTAAAGLPWRFGHNYSSGINQFGSQPIPNCSQDGKYCLFSSDMARNSTGTSTPLAAGTVGLGSTSGTANCTPGSTCRYDLFVMELK